MKKIAVLGIGILILALSFMSVHAAVRVNGYFKKNGTYVQPYYRSNPDGNPYNNYSYPGNTNPYTGVTANGDPNTYVQNTDPSYPPAPVPGVSNNLSVQQQITQLKAQLATLEAELKLMQ